jgi:hypothetical protein
LSLDDFRGAAQAVADAMADAEDAIVREELWLREKAPDAVEACEDALKQVAFVEHACTHVLGEFLEADSPRPRGTQFRGTPCDRFSNHPSFRGNISAYFAEWPAVNECSVLEQLRRRIVEAHAHDGRLSLIEQKVARLGAELSAAADENEKRLKALAHRLPGWTEGADKMVLFLDFLAHEYGWTAADYAELTDGQVVAYIEAALRRRDKASSEDTKNRSESTKSAPPAIEQTNPTAQRTPKRSPGRGEGGTPPARRSKGIPLVEAEILVREWLAANAKDDPVSITRDGVAAGTGVSGGQVSKTAAWNAFRERRDAEMKPGAREVPLSYRMQAAISSECERPDELAALIEEQKKDESEHEHRHRRRHGPS